MMNNTYFGWNKFKDIDKEYFSYIENILEYNLDTIDFISQFPIFVGHVNLGRYLFLYDLYKKVENLNGHIADVGTYKGASFLFFSKLVRLFESHSTTQVHGFDWFEGMKPSKADDKRVEGKYVGSYEMLMELINMQKLNDISIIHKMDVTKELANFLNDHPHLRFKVVYMDIGIKNVLEVALKQLWPRIVNGGILILDHYNLETSPAESEIVEKTVGKNLIRQMPFNRQPTGYVIKEF